jgi:alpha-L-rhamnosidase
MNWIKLISAIGIVFLSLSGMSCTDEGAMRKAGKSSSDGTTVADLRCEYLVNPTGIDVTAPRLSWILASGRRGCVQNAYQVLVASSAETLEANKGDLWNSGKVKSDQSNQIVYEGKPLKSRMRCYWKVRVWDNSGRVSDFSEPAAWTMGLLEPGDWRAKWIGYDASPPAVYDEAKPPKEDLVLPPPPYLRKSFLLNKPVKRAVVYASALGLYELHINGKRVGKDYFTPGWTDYTKRVYYQTYNVTDMLTPSGNAIGAILADGWYAGYIGFGKKREHYGSEPRLLVQLEIEYADGTSQVVATDESWKAAYGPIFEADFLMGETYDGRKEMTDWCTYYGSSLSRRAGSKSSTGRCRENRRA